MVRCGFWGVGEIYFLFNLLRREAHLRAEGSLRAPLRTLRLLFFRSDQQRAAKVARVRRPILIFIVQKPGAVRSWIMPMG